MNDKRNSLTDKVNVTMHSVPKTKTGKDYSYAKVQRNTAYIGNILDKVLKTEKNLTRATLLYASEVLRDGIVELLKEGKSVDLLELGTLYIKPASSMETLTPDVSDVPEMSVSFSPSELALSSVKGVVVGVDVTKSTEPEIVSLLDMKTKSSGVKISAGGTVKIAGKRLKVAGSAEHKVGVFFAPCDADGFYKTDMADWICVPAEELSMGNTSGSLLFNVPESVSAGTYRLAVRTSYASTGRTNKTVREGIFEKVVTVA